MHLPCSKHKADKTTETRPNSLTRCKRPTEQMGTEAGEAKATALGRGGRGASFVPGAQGSPRIRSQPENPEDPMSGHGSPSARSWVQPRGHSSSPVNPRPQLGGAGTGWHLVPQKCSAGRQGNREKQSQQDQNQNLRSKQACKPNPKYGEEV